MADRGRPIPIGAAIYASAHKAVQPPDDRTYSAEVTVFQRNLPHHRIARAVFPYTRSNIIPPRLQIVKKNFRENHKVCFVFSYNLRAAGRPANSCTGLLNSLRHWACSVSLPLNHRRTAGRPVAAANACTGLLYSLRHWACSVSLPLNHRRAAGRPYAIRPIRGFSVQPANQLRLFDHVGISLTKKTCHCEPVRLSGVAIRSP